MHIKIPDAIIPLLTPLADIRQHPDNPNNGDVDDVMESILTNGYLAPITYDANTGYIVAGNTRYAAMLGLGQTHIPAIPVTHFDQANDGARRYMIGDNEIARKARMDRGLELAILEALKETDIGLLGTGIDDNDYEQRLLESAMPPPDPEPEGHGFGPGALGVFQVVIEFDSEDDAEAALADLSDAYDNVRISRL